MRSIYKKILIISLLIIFLLITFSSWAKIPLNVYSPGIVSSLPFFWIKEKGFMNEKMDLKIEISTDHQRALSLITQDEIQMIITGVNVGALAFNKGIGINLLNVNVWGVDYLLTYGFKVEHWENFKAKTLCLPLKGGPLDFVVRFLVQKAGVDINKINLVYMPPSQGVKYFQAGKLDAIVLPEPLVTIALKKTPSAFVSLDIQKEWAKSHQGDPKIPFVGLFSSSSFLQEHPVLVEEFKYFYLQGVKWVNQNTKEAAELAQKHLKIPSSIFEEALEGIDFECISSDQSQERVQECFNEMLEIYPELIDGRLPDEKFYR